MIANNPFRILGIYVNTSAKEQNASLTKIKRYLEVGKTPEFESDYIEFLKPVSRTTDLISIANNNIYLPADKFKHALFWLAKIDSLHEIAFAHFKAGNYPKAFEILSKDRSWSSALNKSTLAFCIGKINYGLENLFKLICDDSLRYDFCKHVCGNGFEIDAEDSSVIVIDILLSIFKPKDLWQYLLLCPTKHSTSLDYLSIKILEKPISIFEKEISKAKDSYSSGPDEIYSAGLKLMDFSKSSLADLLDLRFVSEQRVIKCVDNLANTILQCGINYYNDSNEYDAAKNALLLQEYAQSISIGTIVKDRCKKNAEILRKNIAALPSKEIFEYTDGLNHIYKKYKDKAATPLVAMDMIRECRPIIILAKERLGVSNKSYQNICSNIASIALSFVISSVNAASDKIKNSTSYYKSNAISSAKTILRDAWKATLMMEKLDLSSDFRNGQFESNKKALISIMSNMEVYREFIDVNIDLRTDDEFYDSCYSIDDLDDYLKQFPNGKHRTEATLRRNKKMLRQKKFKKICRYFLAVFSVAMGIYALVQYLSADDRLYKQAIDSKSIEACEAYLLRFPDGNHVKETMKIMSGMENEYVEKHFSKTFINEQVPSSIVRDIRTYYELYKKLYPTGIKRWLVEDYVDVNTQYEDYEKINSQSTIDDYKVFFEKHRNSSTNQYQKAKRDYERRFDWELYKDSFLSTGSQPYQSAYGRNYSFGYYDSYSIITVVAPYESDVIVIVKRNSESGSVAGHVYIRAGDRASIEVPNGTYKPIFYYGKGWKPSKEKVVGALGGFVKDETFSTIQGTEYLYESQVTYTLQLTTNGNLHTKTISESSVF